MVSTTVHMTYCPYCMNPAADGQPCKVCGLTQGSYRAEPHHLPPGTVLKERYLIGRVLGEGGFGITYIGCDLQLEVRVAIKEYFPKEKVGRRSERSLTVSCSTRMLEETFEADLNRFLREARTMAKLAKQPNIVTVYDFFRDNGTAYIVMEYIDGTTFKSLAQQRGGRIPAWELLHLIEPLFFALQTMHDAGLIHRDISPDNIMLENGIVRLLDFGCTRDVSSDKTMTSTLKANYAPVEQYQGKGQGPWTDVYSLAATIYYCLTGIMPPQAVDRLVEDELILPRKLDVDLTERQEAALLRGMHLRRRQRYQSMTEFHAALYEGIEEMKPEPVSPVSVSPAPEKLPGTPEGEGGGMASDAAPVKITFSSASGSGGAVTASPGDPAVQPEEAAAEKDAAYDGRTPAGADDGPEEEKRPGDRSGNDGEGTWAERLLRRVKANPVIVGTGAAAVIVVVIVLALVSGGGSASDNTSGEDDKMTEDLVIDIDGADAEGEDDDTAEEGVVDIDDTETEGEDGDVTDGAGITSGGADDGGEDVWYAGIDLSEASYLTIQETDSETGQTKAVAYVSDGKGISLVKALVDEAIDEIVILDQYVYLETGTTYINKPLTVRSGLYSYDSIIVGEGGILTIDTGDDGYLFMNGLLRAMDGGQIVLSENTSANSEGCDVLLWLESWDNLIMEEGSSLSVGGEEVSVGTESDFILIMDEEEIFAEATEVTSESELRAAMEIESVSSIEITADIVLTQVLEQTKPVRIAEGAVVTAISEEQTAVLDEDGSVTGIAAAAESEDESDTGNARWVICGTVLVNNGTLQGTLNMNESISEEKVVIVNGGTLSVYSNLNSPNALINLESGQLTLTGGSYSIYTVNLGAMTYTPLEGSGDSLRIDALLFFHSGTFRIGGTVDTPAALALTCTWLRLGKTGVMEVGDYADVDADCYIHVDGEITLTSESASMANGGFIYLYSGILDTQAGSWSNSGIVQTDEESRYLCADGTEGVVTALTWTGREDALWIDSAEDLAAALEDDAVTAVWLGSSIFWEGDLVISGGKQVYGCELILSEGNLTVTGEGSVLDAPLDLGGGTLTVTDSAVVIAEPSGEWESDSNIVNCSAVNVENGALLFSNGGLALENAVLRIGTDSSSGVEARVIGLWAFDLDDCTVNIGEAGSLTVYGGLGADGNTRIENAGTLCLEGFGDIAETFTLTGEGTFSGRWYEEQAEDGG